MKDSDQGNPRPFLTVPNTTAHMLGAMAIFSASHPEAVIFGRQQGQQLTIELRRSEDSIECTFDLPEAHPGTSSLTPLCALDAEEIETINGALPNCRLINSGTSIVLVYTPLSSPLGGCAIQLASNRTIQDVWNLANALWTATNEPEASSRA